MHYFHQYSIGLNSVPWSHLNARKPGKYGLAVCQEKKTGSVDYELVLVYKCTLNSMQKKKKKKKGKKASTTTKKKMYILF